MAYDCGSKGRNSTALTRVVETGGGIKVVNAYIWPVAHFAHYGAYFYNITLFFNRLSIEVSKVGFVNTQLFETSP